MYHPFITGERVYLRGIERSDLEGEYFQWLNEYQVTMFTEAGRFPNTKEAMEEYYRNVVLSNNNALFAIIDKKSDQHIGNIKLGPIDWYHRRAFLAYMIGNKDFWGKGYTAEVIKLIFEYGFIRLGLNKICSRVAANHPASLKACEKAGLVVEGRAKSEFYFQGEYYDALYLGITRENFLVSYKSRPDWRQTEIGYRKDEG